MKSTRRRELQIVEWAAFWVPPAGIEHTVTYCPLSGQILVTIVRGGAMLSVPLDYWTTTRAAVPMLLNAKVQELAATCVFQAAEMHSVLCRAARGGDGA